MSSARNTNSVDVGSPFCNMTFNPSGLKIQIAASPAFATANLVNYTIDGIFYAKAAVATQSLLTNSLDPNTGQVYGVGDITIALATTMYFLVCVDAAGNVKVFVGVTKLPNGTVASSGRLPDYPKGYAAIGFIKITTTTATFVPGTTALDAAGLTVVYKDVALTGFERQP